jgi:hypothetical protein
MLFSPFFHLITCIFGHEFFGHLFNSRYEYFAPCSIHSPFYLRIFKKTILYSGFKNLDKKIRKTRNSNLFMNSCPETLTKNAVPEFHLIALTDQRDHTKTLLSIVYLLYNILFSNG